MRRVLVISHTYLPPTNRGKLHALAARGLDVSVGVPERWRDRVLGSTTEVSWERQNGVEVCPLPIRLHGQADAFTFRSRGLVALLRDKRPDLVQVEEEPLTPAAQQVVRAARHFQLPTVLFTHQNVDVSLAWLARGRRRRLLRRLKGAIAASGTRLAGRGDPAARHPGARGAATRAPRWRRDRLRWSLGAGERNRYFAPGVGGEPRVPLASDGGRRRARSGAARTPRVRPATRGADPLGGGAAPGGGAEALARARRPGAAGSSRADLGGARGQRGGRGHGARGERGGDERRRDTRGHRRRRHRGAARRPAGAGGRTAPRRGRRRAAPLVAGGPGTRHATLLG